MTQSVQTELGLLMVPDRPPEGEPATALYRCTECRTEFDWLDQHVVGMAGLWHAKLDGGLVPEPGAPLCGPLVEVG